MDKKAIFLVSLLLIFLVTAAIYTSTNPDDISPEDTYFNGTWYNLIDTNIYASTYSSYDYEMIHSHYKAYFNNNSNTEGAVRFEKDGYFFNYDLSDGQLLWAQQPGKPAATNTLGSDAPSNSQDTQINISGDTAIYPNAFYNTNVTYHLMEDMLKETFIFNGPPTYKDYLYLQYSGNIEFNASLDICANGICYTPSGTQDDFNTTGQIDFRDADNNTIFYLKEPIITDSVGKNTTGIYKVKGSNAQMKFYLLINKTWLQNAVYPVFIDPTIVLEYPDIQYWSKTYCPSIALDSQGNSHIAFNRLPGFATSLALYYCNNTGGTWTCASIYSVNSNEGSTSIAIDSNDKVHLTFYDDTNYDLKYANNTNGTWTFATIDSGGDVGLYNSLAIDMNNKMQVAYYDTTNLNLKYANNSNGTWVSTTLQSYGDVGTTPSIAIDRNNVTHIVFRNSSSSYLIYTNNSGGTWTIKNIEQSGGKTHHLSYSSLAIDLNNNLYVSHMSYVPATVRKCTKLSTSSTWSCSTLSTPGAMDSVTSIAVDRYNQPHIISLLSIPFAESLWEMHYSTWYSTSEMHNGDFLSSEPLYYATDRVIANRLGRLVDSTSFSKYIHIAFYELDTISVVEHYYINPYINVSLNSPSNYSLLNSSVDFNCTAFSYFSDLSNITLYLIYNNGTLHSTTTNNVSGFSVFNSTLFSKTLYNGTYTWNCLAVNNQSMHDYANPMQEWNVQNWTNWTVEVDSISPSLIVNTTTSNGSLTFYFETNTSDNHLSTCFYSVYNSSGLIDGNHSNISVSCNSLIISSIDNYGTFNLLVYVNDTVGNLNISNTSFIISGIVGGEGGGGVEVQEVTIEVPSNQTFCGDGICQTKGNDLGVFEDYFSCPQDCAGFNIDSAIFYCFDNDENTSCVWDSVRYQYVGLAFGILFLVLAFSTVEDKNSRKQIPLFRYVILKQKKGRGKR